MTERRQIYPVAPLRLLHLSHALLYLCFYALWLSVCYTAHSSLFAYFRVSLYLFFPNSLPPLNIFSPCVWIPLLLATLLCVALPPASITLPLMCVIAVLLSPSCILRPPFKLSSCCLPNLGFLEVFVNNGTSVVQVAGPTLCWQPLEVIILLHCCSVPNWTGVPGPFYFIKANV